MDRSRFRRVGAFLMGRVCRLLRVLFIGVQILAAAVTSAASVTLHLDREVIGLGETASLICTVEGGRDDEQPRLPAVQGLRIALTGRSSTSRIALVNGRRTATADLQYTYSVTPARTGEFSVGPVIVGTGGQALKSEPLKLTVVAAGDAAVARRDGLENAAFLTLVVPPRPVYVGETFIADARLHAIGGELKQPPQFQADGFTLGRGQTIGPENNIRTNNRVYSRLRFLQPLTAARSGELTLQAENCIIDIPVRRQSTFSDPFDEIFGGGQRRRFNVGAPPSTLQVLPLPRDDVPPGFTGAVGQFGISLSASPTNLQAGDPITLRIEISGRGNFDSVQLPGQPEWKGFRVYAPNSSFDTQDPLGMEGTKRFEQVVTPESVNTTELPPLVFSYFHPDSKNYRTVRTARIPLQVAPANSAPSLPAPPAGTALASKAPARAAAALAPLKPHLGTVAIVTTPWILRPGFLWLAVLPPLCWAGILAWLKVRRRRDADLEGVRRAALERSIHQGLADLAVSGSARDAERFFATLFHVLQDIVALRAGLASAAVTEGVLESELAGRGVPVETLDRLHALFQACNQARYTRQGGAGDFEPLRAEVESLSRSPDLRKE